MYVMEVEVALLSEDVVENLKKVLETNLWFLFIEKWIELVAMTKT